MVDIRQFNEVLLHEDHKSHPDIQYQVKACRATVWRPRAEASQASSLLRPNDQAQRPPPETPGRLQESRADSSEPIRLQGGSAVRCSALLAVIGSGGSVLAFRSGKTVENPAVSLQTVLIISPLIISDPLDKLSEHRVLLLCRGKL